MSEKTRGVFQVIIKSILGSSKLKIPAKFMGEDFYGTKYFEEPPESSGRKTRGRYFTPKNEDDFDQELPAEWEAWLRYRRTDPPSKEEVEINYKMILTKRENAAKLDREYAATKEPSLLTKKGTEHSSAQFPVYEEYENYGQKK